MAEKLTKAQIDALHFLSVPRYHVYRRASVKALVARGLAQTNEFGCTTLTDAGRSARAAPNSTSGDQTNG